MAFKYKYKSMNKKGSTEKQRAKWREDYQKRREQLVEYARNRRRIEKGAKSLYKRFVSKTDICTLIKGHS